MKKSSGILSIRVVFDCLCVPSPQEIQLASDDTSVRVLHDAGLDQVHDAGDGLMAQGEAVDFLYDL